MKVVLGLLATAAAGLLMAGVAPSAAAPAGASCAPLIQRYRADMDLVNRYAAFNGKVSEHLPPSQQTAAQTRESNAMARARMSLDAARSAGCHPAVLSPTPDAYDNAASMCEIEAIAAPFGGSMEHCRVQEWRPGK